MKKFFVLLFTLASAWVSQAGYLYWQMSTDTQFNGHEIYSYKIYATNGSTKTLLSPVLDGELDPAFSSGEVTRTGNKVTDYYIAVNDDTSLSYYVEVLGYDESAYGKGNVGQIGISQTPMSYSALVSAGAIGTGVSLPTSAWTGTPIAVPEPTSGVLLLMGLSLLGLKRRKV